MNLDERHLKRAMHEAADPLNPPVSELVVGGVARGRQLRRRHVAKVTSGALAVAVAGVGTAFALPQLTPGPDIITADEATVEVGSQPVDEEGHALDENLVADTLLDLLPPGEVSGVETYSEDLLVSISLVYDDGDGASTIQGAVSVVAEIQAAECPLVINGGDCTTASLDDGTELTLMSGPYYPQPDREPDRLDWSASASRSDGLGITLGEINAPTEKGSAVTRPEPPLSLEQLTAIVTSDEWPAPSDTQLAAAAEQDTRATGDNKIGDGQERADLQEARTIGAALAADLGPGWDADQEFLGNAVPSAENAEGLPDGYQYATVVRHISDGDLDELCAGGSEKGSEVDPCEQVTTPDGEIVHVAWGRTQADYYAEANQPEMVAIQDDLNVRFRRDAGGLITVRLWVSEPMVDSTPERRAAAVAWLEGQLDDLIRAATAESVADR